MATAPAAPEAPPPLSDAYHRARRLLALFSGILIAWEYVGISLGEGPTATLTANLPVAETPVTVKNPEVLPVVILIVIFYFIFRITVEWQQCDAHRRTAFFSRIDLWASYIIAASAIILYIFQQLSDFRLADFLTLDISAILSIFASISILIVFIIQMRKALKKATITFETIERMREKRKQ